MSLSTHSSISHASLAALTKKCSVCISLLLIASMTTTATANVYKVVDTVTGQVTFTDAPQNYIKKPVTMENIGIHATESSRVPAPTQNLSSYAAPVDNKSDSVSSMQLSRATLSKLNTNKKNGKENSKESTKIAQINYQLKITSPSEVRAYRSPTQSIDAVADISPNLANGDRLQWLVDGKQFAEGARVSIPTLEVFAGEHKLQVQVVNAKGNVVDSEAIKFYVIKQNNAIKAKRAKEAAIARFNALPWHQKMKLSLQKKAPK